MVPVTLRRWRKEEGRTARLVRLLEGHSPSAGSRSRVLVITSAAFSLGMKVKIEKPIRVRLVGFSADGREFC
jgi:hypothetical protein